MGKKNFLVLLITLSTIFAISGRYRRGRGWGGRYRSSWGRGGYHRPWNDYYGRRNWWGGGPSFGLTIVSDRNEPRHHYNNHIDSRDKNYWHVLNDTPYTVHFKAEGHRSRRLSPGESQKIPHEYGFNFYIEKNGKKISSSTSRHHITIYDRGRGRIGIRKSN